MPSLHDILWTNAHQTLTPELIAGILLGLSYQEDRAIANAIGAETDEYNGITFHVERLSSCLEEVKAHHVMQWAEVERAREGLNPDYATMLDREAKGSYVLFTARKDGVLVGNTGCYLYRSTHNQKLAAKEDTMFLVPAERKGRTAIKFFQFCERQLFSLGVEEITVSTKVTNNVHKLWERQGYEWTDRVLTKTRAG